MSNQEAVLLDLLRVIRHHRARLATPIRTVQKVYSDAETENIPYSDSIFNHGTAASRRMLLIDAPYKINGEDRTKAQSKPRPTDAKPDTKGGTVQNSDLNTKETASKAKESPSADLSADAKVGEMPNAESKEGNKVEEKTPSDAKLPKKVSGKSTPVSATKIDGKSAEQPSIDPKIQTDKTSNKQQPSKVVQGSSPTSSAGISSSSVALPESGGEKPVTVSSSSKQLKQEEEKQPTPQTPSSKPVIEENIVLGVALEGSKRTLPIEEGMVAASNSSEAKEMATVRSGNGPALTDKDKKESKRADDPSSTPDQLDQKE